MGDRGARYRTVGCSAVIFARWRVLGILLALGACSENNPAVTSAGPVSGAAVGIGLGGITANPLIGYAALDGPISAGWVGGNKDTAI